MFIKLFKPVPAVDGEAGDVVDVQPSLAKSWIKRGVAELASEADIFAATVQEEEEDAAAQEPEADEVEGDEAESDEAEAAEEEVKGLKKLLKRGGDSAETAEGVADDAEERG